MIKVIENKNYYCFKLCYIFVNKNMFHDKMIFYSSIGNRFKKLYRNNNPPKLFDERSFSYLDNNGEKIKLKYEIEKERRLFNEFISNMRNYKILDEIKRKNYLSKLKGYKGIDEEKKITELRQKRFNDILELRKRRELINRNISLLNVPSIGSVLEKFLMDTKRKRNKFKNELLLQSQGNDNTSYQDLQNINQINQTSLLSYNSSLNTVKTNSQRNKRNLKLFKHSSNLLRNIIRKRMNMNKSINNILPKSKNQISLFRLKLHNNRKKIEINSQLMSQKETTHTNIFSNESNSATANFNSTTNYTNKNNINSYSNKIKSIKSSINKNFFKQNTKPLNGLQIQIKKRFKFDMPLLLDKSKDKNDNSNLTNIENTKLNSLKNIDGYKYNNISTDNRNKSHEVNKRFYKLKKINHLTFKKLSNNYKASNSLI